MPQRVVRPLANADAWVVMPTTDQVAEAALAAVLRDQSVCVVCGGLLTGIRGHGWSLMYRRAPRWSTNATPVPELLTPANMLSVCGHGTYGCAGEILRGVPLAERLGYLIRDPHLPEHEPILLHTRETPMGSLRYLLADGTIGDIEPAHVAVTA